MKIIGIFYFIAFVFGITSIIVNLMIAISIFLYGSITFHEPNLVILIFEFIFLLISLPFLFILGCKYCREEI